MSDNVTDLPTATKAELQDSLRLAVFDFAQSLYGLPWRLADQTALHPYAVADALYDLLSGPDQEQR